jgi:hypothetical protein
MYRLYHVYHLYLSHKMVQLIQKNLCIIAQRLPAEVNKRHSVDFLVYAKLVHA